MWTNLIIAILTSKPVKRFVAKSLEAAVKSTDTRFDDTLVAPIIKILRS